MARTKTDLGRCREAYSAGHAALGEWLAALPAETWSRSSVLPGWTVGDLAAHVANDPRLVAALTPAARGARPTTVATYLENYAGVAQTIADTARSLAGSAGSLDALVAVHRDHCAAAERVLDELGQGDAVVLANEMPIRLTGYLATRAVEIAVHADDLARSTPDVAPRDVPREVTRHAVRTLLDVLAERAPGRAVEVRVPPYAAVQCVGGPQHTRGTPSNVVEADAGTWLRLAAGRMRWAEALAAGELSASGGRADLSSHLPLL